MSARRSPKAKRRGFETSRPSLTLTFQSYDYILSALDHLLKAFPFTRRDPNQANMAARFLEVALANVEILAPRLAAMIDYCEAEDLKQRDYLQSLIEVKFKKKLHIVKRC